MNIGTKIRTILAIATSLNTALMATDLTGFVNPTLDTVYKAASVILNFIIVACATYFNNDYTETACEYTGEMRIKKRERTGSIYGEYFHGDDGIEEKYEEVDEDDYPEQ